MNPDEKDEGQPQQPQQDIPHKDRHHAVMPRGIVTVSLMTARDLREDGDTQPLGLPNTALAVTEFSVPTQHLTPYEVARIIGLRAGEYLSFGEDVLDQVEENIHATSGGDAGAAPAANGQSGTDFQA